MATEAFARQPIVHEPTRTRIPPLREYCRGVWDCRELIWNIARTDKKAEHYDTALGRVWVILDPLLLAGVYYFVRSVIRPLGARDVSPEQLLSHLIWAIFFFYLTSKALNAGARSITSNKGLILNTSFPKAVFPIVALHKSAMDFIPTLAVYFLFHAILGQPFASSLLALPVFLALQLLFTFGLVLLFAPLTVFFRDTTGFLPYVTRLWLYLTPILYMISEIPEQFRTLFLWNPLYPFFGAYEQIFGGRWPSVIYLLGSAAWAFSVFLVGAAVF